MLSKVAPNTEKGDVDWKEAVCDDEYNRLD